MDSLGGHSHSFVYVEKHIKVNYHSRLAKSKRWREVRGGKNIKFPISESLVLECFSKSANNDGVL